MSKTICIITQSHLCRNPRVLKEAIALSSQQYTVRILTVILSDELYREDLALISGYPGIRIQAIADLSRSNYRTFLHRSLYKAGRLLIKYLKLETSLSLGYASGNYLKASKVINAHLYICHQELATYIGTQLIKAGYKVAFDLEDWYSEDLLPEARCTRPIKMLKQAEQTALKKGLFCITTSNVMAHQLALNYQSPLPGVIYNTFPAQPEIKHQHPSFQQPLKLFWFSQTIGPGRGLEEFIRLSSYIGTGFELHLLGAVNESYSLKLHALMPKLHQLFFHQPVNAKTLPVYIAQFDIGLALEQANPPSRNYTITNKIFQYLQAGLPVIATETAGQKEIFEKFPIGLMLPQQPAAANGDALNIWLNDQKALQQTQAAVKNAADFYSWETESKKLINLVADALQQ
jgi:glycosyltransferase involved in cell wall biosynthesis